MKTFPHLEVKGDAAARGGAHGEAFRERIEKTFSFYMDDLFASSPLSGAEIEARANRIKALTVEAAPDCAAEISGIAAGANLEEWKLFVLNARTEILNAKVTECTAFYFAESQVLAQNWDWVEPLEDLAVAITHERDDGRRYAVFVETGMIGKSGLNSDGLGVCLNIL
ncbi:MAG: C45 family autoproteolytic acyltransferase/hydrolase, partial [Proteobacteria bacterium]|nr:C45 family autoproteolytic acyltransferase/hydrolase [Pseudomonadota bacterium]